MSTYVDVFGSFGQSSVEECSTVVRTGTRAVVVLTTTLLMMISSNPYPYPTLPYLTLLLTVVRTGRWSNLWT